MKTPTLSFTVGIAGALLWLGLCSAPAAAQNVTTVQVPFDFHVRDQVLPAGKYTIRRDLALPQWLQLQSADGKHFVPVITIPHLPPGNAQPTGLVFRKYGEQRFLADVQFAERENGFALIPSKAEREMQQLAAVESLITNPPKRSSNQR